MARRKRKEEEPAWSPPEFDEVEYMRREISGARSAVVVIAWAALGALVSYGLLVAGLHWAIAFLAGLFVFAGLYYVMPLLGLRISSYKRRDWAGHAVTYFFSWLAVWILLLNAPFGDFTNPTIHGILVGTYAGSGDPAPGSVACVAPTGSTADLQGSSNTTILLVFRATDNVGVTSVQVAVGGGIGSVPAPPVAAQPHGCANAGSSYPGGTYVAKIPIMGTAQFPISIAALDAQGRRAEAFLTVLV